MREIGAAFVRLMAKDDALKADLQEAKQTVKAATDEMQGDAAKVGGGFKGAGEAIEGATEPARKFAGAISSTVGIATGMIGAFTAISGIMVGLVALGRKLSEEFGGVQDEVSDTVKAIRDLKREVAELKGESTEAFEGEELDALGRAAAQARSEVLRLEEKLAAIREAMRSTEAPEATSSFNTEKLEDELSKARTKAIQLEAREAEARRLERVRKEQEDAEKLQELYDKWYAEQDERRKRSADERAKREREAAIETAKAEAEERKRLAMQDREAAKEAADLRASMRDLAKELNANTTMLQRVTGANSGAFGFTRETADEIIRAIRSGG
jgi:chromosome segregation ATPase